MIFLDMNFMIGFILLAILSYFLKGKGREYLLIIANCAFYYYISGNNWIYLLAIIVFVYYVASQRNFRQRKSCLTISIIIIVFGLFISKYFIFFTNLIGVDSSLKIIAPIGISFFTFKCISFLVDVYRGTIKEFTFKRVFTYITFFPQIISGPIDRFQNFDNQITHDLGREFSYNELKTGFILFCFGCFEKFVLSARFSILANQIYNNLEQMHGIYILIAMIAYSFQIYTDFDAYSNMAIGLAKMLGIETCQNFNTPYLARNIQDFWRRWHISLSTWFRDYIYIPLGGNRTGHKYFNVFVVSIVSGLWHGASLNFVIWGCLHGFAQTIFGKFHDYTKNVNFRLPFHLGRIISVIFTFLIVTCLWVFFRFQDLGTSISIFELLLTDFSFKIDYFILDISKGQFYITVSLIILVIILDLFRYFGKGIQWFNNLNFIIRWFIYIIIILGFILFAVYGSGFRPEDFIYIQF